MTQALAMTQALEMTQALGVTLRAAAKRGRCNPQ